MATEYLDVFDSQHQLAGYASREEVHRLGLWHQTFQCWIGGHYQGRLAILVQRRAKDKANHPGLLDISAAGHLQRGEGPEDGVREIDEELGLHIGFEHLRFVSMSQESFRTETEWNNEFCFEYAHVLSRPITGEMFCFRDAEVAALYAADLESLESLFASREPAIVLHGWENGPRQLVPVDHLVRCGDFVPRPLEYYRRWLNWFRGSAGS